VRKTEIVQRNTDSSHNRRPSEGLPPECIGSCRSCKHEIVSSRSQFQSGEQYNVGGICRVASVVAGSYLVRRGAAGTNLYWLIIVRTFAGIDLAAKAFTASLPCKINNFTPEGKDAVL
jgi:hypothetical protein